MKKLKLFKELLKKYKFNEELPLEIQKEMLKAKKKVLINIFKKKGHYSIFMFLVVSLFYYLRIIGLGTTITKSSILIVVGTIFSVAIISGSGYLVVKTRIKDVPKQNMHQQDHIKKQNPQNRNQPYSINDVVRDQSKQIVITKQKSVKKEKKIQTDRRYKLDVVDFELDSQSKLVFGTISKFMVQMIRKQIGKNSAQLVVEKSKTRSSKILLGSIIAIDDIYLLTVKLIDVETTDVLYYKTKKIKGKHDINSVCEKLAKEISKKIQ